MGHNINASIVAATRIALGSWAFLGPFLPAPCRFLLHPTIFIKFPTLPLLSSSSLCVGFIFSSFTKMSFLFLAEVLVVVGGLIEVAVVIGSTWLSSWWVSRYNDGGKFFCVLRVNLFGNKHMDSQSV